MSKPPFPFHPIAVALYPPLFICALNRSMFELRDALQPGLILLAAVVLLTALFGIPQKNIQRGALPASLIVASIFSYRAFEIAARRLELHVAGTEFMFITIPYGVVVTAAVIGLCWRKYDLATLTRFANVCSTVMLAFAALPLVTSAVSNRTTLVVQGNEVSTGPKPDIYYIVLDGFGRPDVVDQKYGTNLSEFQGGLTDRGLFVATKAHSNYCQTELSMSSSLNMEYVQKLAIPKVSASETRSLLDVLITDSRVSQELRTRGYKYIAISTGFPALKFKTADRAFEERGATTLFWSAMMERTPFPMPAGAERSMFDTRRKLLNQSFDIAKEVASSTTQPKFVVMHVLAPHPPFVFGPNGEVVEADMPFGLWDGSHYMGVGGDRKRYREGYAAQATYIGKRVLKLVDDLNSQSASKPIIVIQGDHGPKMGLDQESLERTDIREVFSILSAYQVPDSVKARLYPSITPINSFRVILSEVLSMDLKPTEDRSHYSTWDEPMEFEDVTTALSQ